MILSYHRSRVPGEAANDTGANNAKETEIMVCAHFDVFHHATRLDLADLREHLVQLFVGHRLRQIVDDQVRHARVLRLHFGVALENVGEKKKAEKKKKKQRKSVDAANYYSTGLFIDETADHGLDASEWGRGGEGNGGASSIFPQRRNRCV